MDELILRTFPNSPTKTEATNYKYNVTGTYFQVPSDRQEKFWTSYCLSVQEKINPFCFELVQRKDQNVQLAFDVFLAFEKTHMSTRIDIVEDAISSIHEYIKRVIAIIQIVMGTFFEKTPQGSESLVCYLTRNNDNILTWNGSQVEFKARIIFPYAFIQSGHIIHFQRLLLTQLQLQSSQLLAFLSVSPINGLDTLLRPIGLEMCEMYGSSESYGSSVYELRHIYGLLTSDTETVISLEQAFFPVFHLNYIDGTLKAETIHSYTSLYGLKFWLPLFFSQGYYARPLIEKHAGLFTMVDPEGPRITMKVIKESGDFQSQIERVRQLLSMMDPARVENYWSWYDIGISLHSINRSKEGLDLWKYVTSRSDYKSDQDCEELWYQFNGSDGTTIATLEWFASHDNSEMYQQFNEKDVNDALNKAIFEQQEKAIAKAFRACFPFDFVCSSYSDGTWFVYRDHRWIEDDGTSTLMWDLNERFQPKLEKMRAELANRIIGTRDQEFKSRSENTISAITELIKRLGGNSFKERVSRELRIYYQCRRFYNKKDLNPFFTGTPNGILDLRGGKYCLRPGKPEDFITKTTNCMFPETFTWQTPLVQEVLQYIEKVFRNRNIRNYFWRLMGKILYSGNIDKIFPIWTGEGNNSKSILVRLIEAALGSYAIKLPVTFITETNKESNRATPVLIHSQGAKVGFLQEPNRNQPIQSGSVKELTGHDTMYVRELFQKGSKIVEMEITIVPILITNKIPNIPDCQQAIWERTHVTEFNSRWGKEAPLDPQQQYQEGFFKMDRFFDRQIPRMAPAFLWIMAQKYEEYAQSGLEPSPEVLQATDAFRISNNKFIHFIRDSIIQVVSSNGTPDMSARVGLDELYSSFRKWYNDQQYREKIPNKSEFKENIEMIWRQKGDENNSWGGIRLNQPSSLVNLLSGTLF